MIITDVESALIQKTELFSSLKENEIEFVISRSGRQSLPRDGVLFSTGEKARHFYILISGTIRVYNPNEDGSQDEMARFTTGDTIGDFDFARGAEYNACAEAAENSELIVFPDYSCTMESLAQEDPRIICSIYSNAILMMTRRIKSTMKLILDNMSWVQELHRRAYEDAGTGLWKQALIADEIIGVLADPSALIMIKPDRFKILVDSRGHSAGDEAMIRIALIMKNMTRQIGHGWALRFKSNEVGLIFNNCGAAEAEKIAEELAAAISAMEPVPAQNDIPEFHFSATISWGIWPKDDPEWDNFFQGNYASLLDAWKADKEKIIRYKRAE